LGSGNTTSPNAIDQSGYVDSSRTVETYNASLGGTASLSAFMATADNQNMINWNTLYTADAVNTYIRAGFGIGSNLPSPPPPPSTDTTPPQVIIIAPSGVLPYGTTGTPLTVHTNENATCAYSNTSGTAFASMAQFSTTGNTSHWTRLSGLSNGSSYTYYVKCKDTAGNISTDSSTSFSVALTAPASPPSGGAPKTIFLTSGTSWTVPSNWNSSNNTIECIRRWRRREPVPEICTGR
jgi:hypothetical protein